MRITEDTDHRLTLEDRPRALSAALLVVALLAALLTLKGYVEVNRLWVWSGAILASACLTTLFTQIERVRLVLDRAEGVITLTRRAGRRRNDETFDLADLVAARLERRPEAEGEGRSETDAMRVQLHIDGHPDAVPVTRYLSGQTKSPEIVRRINAWMTAGERTAG